MRTVAAARKTGRAQLDKRSRCQVVHGGAIGGIDRRRVVLITQSQRRAPDRRGRAMCHWRISRSCAYAGAPDCSPSPAGLRGSASTTLQRCEQETGEIEKSARFDIAVGVLLARRRRSTPNFTRCCARTQVALSAICQVLVVPCSGWWIGPGPRKPFTGGQRQSPAVARIRRKLRQSELPIDAGALALLIGLRSKLDGKPAATR